MKLLKLAALCAVVLTGGCATNEYGARWQRIDGGPVGRGFDRAIAHCRYVASERFERQSATQVMQRCMERHGYVWAVGYTGNYYYNDRYRDRYYD